MELEDVVDLLVDLVGGLEGENQTDFCNQSGFFQTANFAPTKFNAKSAARV